MDFQDGHYVVITVTVNYRNSSNAILAIAFVWSIGSPTAAMLRMKTTEQSFHWVGVKSHVKYAQILKCKQKGLRRG